MTSNYARSSIVDRLPQLWGVVACWSKESSGRWNTPHHMDHVLYWLFFHRTNIFYTNCDMKVFQKNTGLWKGTKPWCQETFQSPFFGKTKQTNQPSIDQKVLKGFRVMQTLKLVRDLFLKAWPLYSWPLRNLEIECSYLECELLFKDFLSRVSQGQNRHSES